VLWSSGRHQGRRAAGIDELAQRAEHGDADDGRDGPPVRQFDAAEEAQVRDADHDAWDGQGSTARETGHPDGHGYLERDDESGVDYEDRRRPHGRGVQLGDEYERKRDLRNTEAEHVDDVRGEQQAHRGNGSTARSRGRPGVAGGAVVGGSGRGTGTDSDAIGERGGQQVARRGYGGQDAQAGGASGEAGGSEQRAQAEAGVAHRPARGQRGIALAACGDSGDEGGVRRRDTLASETEK